MFSQAEGSVELVQVTIGQFTLQHAVQFTEGGRSQQIGRGRQRLADLQIGLAVQIGRFDVAQGMGLAANSSTC